MIADSRALDYTKDLDKLSSLYSEIKQIVLLAENVTAEKAVVLSAINELRNAFDHIMRCHLDECDYTEHVRKAKGHLYRAGYDAYEIIAIDISEWIKKLLSEYKAPVIARILPDYYTKILPLVDSLEKRLRDARANKKVGNSSTHTESNILEKVKEEFEEYSNLVTELSQVKDNIEAAIPTIEKIDSATQKLNVITKQLKPYSSDLITKCIDNYYTEIFPVMNKLTNYKNDGTFTSGELDSIVTLVEKLEIFEAKINGAMPCLSSLHDESKKNERQNRNQNILIGLFCVILGYGLSFIDIKQIVNLEKEQVPKEFISEKNNQILPKVSTKENDEMISEENTVASKKKNSKNSEMNK